MGFDESIECLEELLRDRVKELPWCLCGKETTCQRFFYADSKGRRFTFSSSPGRILHAEGQLSPCATTTEPVLESLGAESAEPTCSRAYAPQQEKPLQ